MKGKTMRRLKSLKSLENATFTWTVQNEGTSRPATEAEIAHVRNSFAAALRQGNVTVNGKPVDPVTGKIAARKRR